MTAFKEGAGQGTYVKSNWPHIEKILTKKVKEYFIINQKAVLPVKGRPMIFLTTHGSLNATFPAMAIIAKAYMDNGLGDMVIGIYPHPAVLWIPGMKWAFKKAGTPVNAYEPEKLMDLLNKGILQVTGTAPEGLSCNFAWDEYVGPLRSGGMMEVAIKTGATICLVAHQGGDLWNIRVRLPFGLKVPLTGGLRGINIPLPPVRVIKKYGVYFKRYKPGITATAISKMNKREKRLALNVEMAKVKSQFMAMTDKVMEKM